MFIEHPVLREIIPDNLIRSGRSSTGYKGVRAHYGRYQAQCGTPPCTLGSLGTFDTKEEAAQAYLQHRGREHQAALEKERKAA